MHSCVNYCDQVMSASTEQDDLWKLISLQLIINLHMAPTRQPTQTSYPKLVSISTLQL